MPELKDLTCTIKYGKYKSPLKEYGTTYVDGYVETFVAVPQHKDLFEVHITSEGKLPTGVAAFVYIDGVAQCTRSETGFGKPGQGAGQPKGPIDLRLRQKEDNISGDRFLARRWHFEEIKSDSSHEISSENWEKLESVGTIEVVVLRAESRMPPVQPSAQVQAKAKEDTSKRSNQKVQVYLPFSLDGADERHLDENYHDDKFKELSGQYDGPSNRSPRRRSSPHRPSAGQGYHSGHENAYHPSARARPSYYPPPPPGAIPIYDPYTVYGPSPPRSTGDRPGLYEQTLEPMLTATPKKADRENSVSPPAYPYVYHGSPYHSPRYHQQHSSHWPHHHAHLPAHTGIGITGVQTGTWSPNHGVRYHDSREKDKQPTSPQHSQKTSKPNDEKKNESADPWGVNEPFKTDNWGNKDSWGGGNNDSGGWGANENIQTGDSGWDVPADNDTKVAPDWNTGNVVEAPMDDNTGPKDAWGAEEQNKQAGDFGWGNNKQASNTDWLKSTAEANDGGDNAGGFGDWGVEDKKSDTPAQNWGAWGGEEKKVESPAKESSKSRKHKKHKASGSAKGAEGVATKSAAATGPGGSYLKSYFTTDPASKDANERAKTFDPAEIAPAEPMLAVPKHVVEKTGATHQVCVGPAYVYNFYTPRPRYLDSMSKPYAVFCFKFRSHEKVCELFPALKEEGKIKKERGDYKKSMMDMSKEQLLEQLRKAKVCAGYNTDSTLDSSSSENGDESAKKSGNAAASSKKKDGKGKGAGW